MQQKRYHIIIDVSGVAENILTDAGGLRRFLRGLPSVIGMHVLKGPVTATGIAANPGLSGFVIIDYSHISVHTFTQYREALVDIFSCKPYDKEAAIAAVLTYLHATPTQARIQVVRWE